MQNKQKVQLILEDGTTFSGFSFGAARSAAGEVVFNTAMTGYPESLTDPSYKGQILVSTFPLIGNYGVPSNETDENNIPLFHESNRIHVQGLIVSDYSFEHSHWNAEKSLHDWLCEYDIPGIYGIDTRALTMTLREKGSMLGKIIYQGQDTDWYDPNKDNLVAQVSTKEIVEYGKGKHRIVMVDTGAKYNIIRCLVNRDATVVLVPWDYDFTQLEYDGLMLANGPGNPDMCAITIEHIKKALNEDKPIFGICLGNQLMGIAAGGSAIKLKYGHRSHNQPVLATDTNSCFITSQNHGYVLNTDSLNQDWEPGFVNVNDQTNEGIRHKNKPFFSTQFHPEACGGPTDTINLFDQFIKNIEQYKKK